MAKTIFHGLDELKAAAGTHLGYTDYITMTQERVNQFAEATGDHQWIHVDVERATKESPFGAPIAHGYLTLSLIPWLGAQLMAVEGVKLGVNYGANRIRFMSPVPVGAKLRLGAKLLSVEELPGGWSQSITEFTLETEGSTKPSCVSETITRYLF
jgi:acyl dehydratase